MKTMADILKLQHYVNTTIERQAWTTISTAAFQLKVILVVEILFKYNISYNAEYIS